MIIREGKFMSEIELEDLSLAEYNNFLKIKQLPSYEMEKEVFKVNTEFLKMIDKKYSGNGKKIDWDFPEMMFDYEIFIIKLAFLKRKFAVFADCGLGKTAIMLDWLEKVKKVIPGDKKLLLVSPLNIIEQTLDEQEKFYDKRDIVSLHDYSFDRWINSSTDRVGIINYDKFKNRLDFKGRIGALAADETDILKSETGVIKTNLIEESKPIDYKLCCTATPAPNDREEYANHALHLNYIRNYQEFFHRYFINKDSKWVLKPHATEAFYRFLATFSIFLRDPKSFGFEDNLKNVPIPNIQKINVPLTTNQREEAKKLNSNTGFGLSVKIGGISDRTKYSQISKGFLYTSDKTKSIDTNKPQIILDILNKHRGEKALIWTNYDSESDILEAYLKPHFDSVVKVTGKTKIENRLKAERDFKTGKIEVLISNSNIFAKGMNFQICTVMIFSGLDDSLVKFHHGIKRAARYGSTKQLQVYIPVTKYEEVILQNVLRKKNTFELDANIQEGLYKNHLIDDLKEYANKEQFMSIKKEKRKRIEKHGDNWTLVRNDNIEELEALEENSIDFSIFSPPFSSLFTYSSDIADQGNSGSDEEFCLNYKFFAKRLLRVIRPGRIVAVHVSQLPILKHLTGYSGMKDFRGLIIEAMNISGFEQFGEVAIKKNQQLQSVVKHAAGLSMSVFEKDSTKCKPAFNDYILLFKKPGENQVPVRPMSNKEMTKFDSNNSWVRFASGCWMINEEKGDIKESNTLNTKFAKSDDDVKHICPLQLEVIRRLVLLYTNPGELVLDPFNGIFSTGYVALENKRKYLGIELKKEYFDASINTAINLEKDINMKIIKR